MVNSLNTKGIWIKASIYYVYELAQPEMLWINHWINFIQKGKLRIICDFG